MVTECKRCHKDLSQAIMPKDELLCFNCFAEINTCERCLRISFDGNPCNNCKSRDLPAAEYQEASVIGFREYSIKQEYWDTPPTLLGAFCQPWETSEMHYKCLSYKQEIPYTSLFDCIDGGHRCGIYMYKTLPYYHMAGEIWAECIGWGEVVEFSMGYRCSDVRLLRLTISLSHNSTTIEYQMYKRRAMELAKKYKLPVSIENDMKTIYYIDGSQL